MKTVNTAATAACWPNDTEMCFCSLQRVAGSEQLLLLPVNFPSNTQPHRLCSLTTSSIGLLYVVFDRLKTCNQLCWWMAAWTPSSGGPCQQNWENHGTSSRVCLCYCKFGDWKWEGGGQNLFNGTNSWDCYRGSFPASLHANVQFTPLQHAETCGFLGDRTKVLNHLQTGFSFCTWMVCHIGMFWSLFLALNTHPNQLSIGISLR